MILLRLDVIRARMAADGIKWPELARRMSVSYHNLMNLKAKLERDESHNVTLKTVGRLCYALNCRPADLIEYVPRPY